MRRVYAKDPMFLDPDYHIRGKPPKVAGERKGTIWVYRVVRRRVDRKKLLGEG